MGHRQLSGTSQAPGLEHTDVWNHLHLQHPFPSGNGSSVIPIENTASSGLNTTPYFNSVVNFNEHAPSSSSNIPPVGVPSNGRSYDLHHHQFAAGCYVHFPSNYSQHAVPPYIQNTQYGSEGDSVDSQVESGRFLCTRRKPAEPMIYDPANTSGYYMGGSSSDIPSSSHHLHQMPAPGSQIQSWDGMISNYRGKDPILSGEGSSRNVRPRYTYAHQFDPAPGGAHLSSHFQSTRGFSAPNMIRQWDHNSAPMALDGRALAAESGCMNNMVNQPHFESGRSSGSIASDERCYHDLIPNRSRNDPRSILHPAQAVRVGNSYGQSLLHPYEVRADQLPSGIAESFSEDGRGGPATFSYSAPFPIGRSRSRERRMRSSFGRLQSYPAMENGHGRWMAQDLIAGDRSMFLNPGGLSDQHRDMRLDIDNMSYEELLDLGERIGNVNTGLSEDLISKCLTRIIYSLPYEAQGELDDDNCVICLEGFKNGEELGFLKCEHGYHVNCIKQWLHVKNACPICKSSAVEK